MKVDLYENNVKSNFMIVNKGSTLVMNQHKPSYCQSQFCNLIKEFLFAKDQIEWEQLDANNENDEEGKCLNNADYEEL